MHFFRSEEHALRWRKRTDRPHAILDMDQAAQLAHAWYSRKLAPEWRRHTADEAEALFARLGLDRDFWRLH